MRKLALIVALCCVSLTFAQQGINYKALIKDANNAVVANQSITVQFSILQGVSQTNVYQETQTPTTDANGIIIVNIGEGTVDSGVFDDIDWASDDHFLNTQIDTGSGLVDMGTTGFKTVPYALSAKTAANVTGLEAIDEGNGNGLVRVGRDAANYGDVGEDAVDLSYSNGVSATRGAIGDNSIAIGFNTTAKAYQSLAIGRNNKGDGNSTSWVSTDPIFEIGIGFGQVPRNALTVLKNGNTTVNGHIYGERVAFSASYDALTNLDMFYPYYIVEFNDFTDTYNVYNPTTEQFTAPRAGLYFFSTSLTFDGGDGTDDTLILMFSVNGSTALGNEILINPNFNTTIGNEMAQTHSMVLNLSQGDTVSVLIQDIEFNSTVRVKNRTFTGYYLGD